MAHEHESRDRHHHPQASGMKPHVKWTAIGIVALMLVALAIYVLTNDESVVPGSPQKTPAPTNP